MINTKLEKMINIDEHLDEAVQLAKKLYLSGTIFIHPTDTIYGFAANPFNEEALKNINEIKGRELGKKYILLINNIENLLKYIDIESEKHIDFLLSIWPNPVSVVLKLNLKTSRIINSETAAFRIPNHRFCSKLLDTLNMPMISTSVNRKNQKPIVEPSVIRDEFADDVPVIFYSEKKSFYESSTLIDLSDSKPVLLREGKIRFDDLIEKFG
jgi:L-threonylcarbamoyladenylate synthase